MKSVRTHIWSHLAAACVLLARGARADINPFPAFETVNNQPQLTTSGPNNFYIYWGVWRTLTSAERDVLRRERGSLIFSNRRITWTTVRCDDGSVVNANGEDVWYVDPIRFDSEGRIEPIPEAVRPDYRYFSLMNMNGMKLAGSTATSVKGLRGEVELDSRIFLFKGRDAPSESGFLDLRAFHNSPDPLNQAFFGKTHPYRWPVYYDERAHKGHSLQAPKNFEAFQPKALSKDHFRMKLVWESCDGFAIGVEGLVPGGVMPVGGPNRPMREDHGDGPLPIGVLKD
jgi:hypothetical protein